MTNVTLGDYIAIAAAIISLFGALTAWAVAKRASTLGTYGRVGESLIRLNGIFVDNPELRPYFIDGKKSYPKGQENKAKAIAVMMLNIFEEIWSQRLAMGREERLAWGEYIANQIQSVRLIRQSYQEKSSWYPNLKRLIEPTKLKSR